MTAPSDRTYRAAIEYSKSVRYYSGLAELVHAFLAGAAFAEREAEARGYARGIEAAAKLFCDKPGTCDVPLCEGERIRALAAEKPEGA